MPKKNVNQKQKQRQKQSLVVNVNLAKAQAKKSRSKKSGNRGSPLMLPPPIYVSPLDRLTPSIYNSQGQQIKQQSIDKLLKNFLSNQQKQQVGSFNTLGTAPKSSDLDAEWEKYKGQQDLYDELRMVILNERAVGGGIDLPTPFQDEERTYLKVSEPDDNINVPKFSQNEARVTQGNIYESSRRPDKRPPVIIKNEDNFNESSINIEGEPRIIEGEPRIIRPRKPRKLRRGYEIVDTDTNNPYP